MLNREANRPAASNGAALEPWRFGNRADQVEVSRRGGIASGLARRLKDERRLEARVLELRNGQAIYAVLRDKRARDAELAAARIAADRDVVELETWAIRAREDLEAALAELRQVDEQLERQRARLEAARSDKVALAAYLRELGEDRVAEACDANGWIERESESDAVE